MGKQIDYQDQEIDSCSFLAQYIFFETRIVSGRVP